MNIKSVWDIFTDQFSFLPIHPQYIIKGYGETAIRFSIKYAKGTLVDIGCGRMPYRQKLISQVNKYIGIDHPKTSTLYKGQMKPDIYADATKIPLESNYCDTAILLMVAEHLPEPQKALIEVNRILKKSGVLILSTVQNYPVHDPPYDYQRFTKYGLMNLLANSNFKIIEQKSEGNIIVLCLQYINLSLVLLLKKIIYKKPLGLFALTILPFVTLICVILNLLSLPFILIKQDSFALTHTFVAKKK